VTLEVTPSFLEGDSSRPSIREEGIEGVNARTEPTGIQRTRIERGDRALSLEEVEGQHGIPKQRMRLLLEARLVDFFRFGRSLFVSERSLEAFLERNRERAERLTG